MCLLVCCHPMWKNKVSLSVLAGLAGSVAIAMVFVGLISPECPIGLAGDHGLWLRGTAPDAGWIGFEVEGRMFRVDVETGDTAEQIGPRITELMKAAGVAVDCERYDGEHYMFIVRNVDGFPGSVKTRALSVYSPTLL